MKAVQKLRKFSRSSNPQALPTRLRKKRFRLFEEMVNAIREVETRPLSVGDFGGTAAYWDQVYDMDRNPLNLNVTLINYRIEGETDDRFRYLEADVRDLAGMPENGFHICFSNSLIEHLGDLSVQAGVVREMLRVSRYLYLQTPNRGFFWEPHYAMPFVHWLSLPRRMNVLSIVMGTSLTEQYDSYVGDPIRLLSRSELQYLFPTADFDHRAERIIGIAKSFVIRSRLLPAKQSATE